MNNSFYKIGFFVLLGIIIVGSIYLFVSAPGKSTDGFKEKHKVSDSLAKTEKDTPKMTSPQEERYRRLVDSVQMVKDSINSVVAFMIDSIDLKVLAIDQRNVYAETFNTLARIKLHMDFILDNERLRLLKTESDKLASVIAKYDKKKEKLNNLSNRLKTLTSFIKITIDVLVLAASKGKIVAPPQT